MKKKVIIGLSVLALVALMAVGTWAWFTAEAGPVGNTFTAGTVKISLENTFTDVTNWNPGDSKTGEITVKNDGTKAAYVRVKLDASWEGNLEAANVELAIGDSWVKSGEYYYYKGELAANATTPNLLSKVTLKGAETGNNYQGKTFTVKVSAEAVQASNDAYKDVWSLTALPWLP